MLDCMTYAIASARKTHESVSGLVTIPLPYVEDQLSPPTDHPALAELLRSRWAYGRGRSVPGLYLFRWGTDWVETDVEEYRMGLPQPDSRNQVYYRAWRTLEDREQDPGEWNRAIYVFSPAEHPRYLAR